MLRRTDVNRIVVCIASAVVCAGLLLGGAVGRVYAVCGDCCAYHDSYNIQTAAGVITHFKTDSSSCYVFTTEANTTWTICNGATATRHRWVVTNTSTCTAPARWGQDPWIAQPPPPTPYFITTEFTTCI